MITEEQLKRDFAETQAKDPLHGVSLKTIVEFLEAKYGWRELSNLVDINCFKMNPSVKSSLTFLRKTEWAREKVQSLYLYTLRQEKREKNGSK
jgi:uncharacterized protein (DUF2132 family)